MKKLVNLAAIILAASLIACGGGGGGRVKTGSSGTGGVPTTAGLQVSGPAVAPISATAARAADMAGVLVAAANPQPSGGTTVANADVTLTNTWTNTTYTTTSDSVGHW